jgi:hypothetical protein
MQFQVPQFIESEDKIVGPLSLRQFGFMAAAFVLSAMLYFTVQTWFWALCSVFIVGAAAGLAFVKIEGRPLINIALSAFNFYWKPQTYIWKPEAPKLPVKEAVIKEESQSDLEEILSKAARAAKQPRPVPITREAASTGLSLHKAWEDVQTGASFQKKNSDRQFLERKMAERYQIFQQITGERKAARRVDYR